MLRNTQRLPTQRQHLVRNGLFSRLFRELGLASFGDHRSNPKARVRLARQDLREKT
jgi:hypothetical protein